jgi:hemin uptake protein HemP
MHAATRTLTLASTGHGAAALHRYQPAGQGNASAADALSVDSQALLQGHKTVEIKHNGFIYRLQATKLGKLILTK